MRTSRLIGGIFIALAGAQAARANLLTNGSLETALALTLPDNLIYASPSHNANALSGWTITSGTIDIVPNSYYAAGDGTYSVDLVGTPGIGSIQQIVPTVATTGYTLTFDFAINPEHGWVIDESHDTKILQVQALNGATVLASQNYTGQTGTRTKTNLQYSVQTFNFTATGANTTIVLRALAPLNIPSGMNANTIYTGPVVDNLDLEVGGGNVPEPGSLSLLALAAPLMLRRRQRR